jgi:glycosyltransferase involved in cell wall biosynthesis
LGQALNSLARQTLSDFEIVAVDDGSCDDTLALLQSWATSDARLSVIAQPHSGIVAALAYGLAACRAPYVARMDADDLAHPERLAQQVAYLDQNSDVAIVSCQVRGFPAEQVREGFRIYIDWQNSLLTDADIRREMFIESPLVHPSVTFRRDWVARVGGYQDRGWPEDYDLWLRFYLAGARFARLPEVLLDWREYPDRLTRTDSRYSVENFLRAKAHYLVRGPLLGREVVILWGAGMMGRRLSKQLQRLEVPLIAFVDIDPAKIGRTRRGLPIIPPEALLPLWRQSQNPALLAAVGARGARQLIRQRLTSFGLIEGRDWWCVA